MFEIAQELRNDCPRQRQCVYDPSSLLKASVYPELALSSGYNEQSHEALDRTFGLEAAFINVESGEREANREISREGKPETAASVPIEMPANVVSGIETTDSSASLTVLILGDSMSLCGFGQQLDRDFRRDPRVKSTFTYMACGTIPLSWLKQGPFTHIKTYCGFWSIESVPGSSKPKQYLDTYGMKRGYRPSPHAVPKLDDLLATIKPDVLVMQTGTNLFDLFRDRSTVRPEQHGAILRNLISPFISEALKPPSALKKIYWVASPTSGRMSAEVQNFLFDRIRSLTGDTAVVIDSRELVAYPYRHMARDREHFAGAQMDEWADKVFAIIDHDLSAQPLSSVSLLRGRQSSSKPNEQGVSAKKDTQDTVSVIGKLVLKSRPLSVEELLPYQESLVAFVYDVQEILQGEYKEKQILVMHPAHIGLKSQPLNQYQVGNTYTLRLHSLEGTPWNTVKSRDDSGQIELEPYILIEDESKFPSHL